MKITKFGHSCMEITEGNSRLIIDPGEYSKTFTDFANIQAVVITHVHQDHFDREKVNAIIAANPEVQIFAPNEVFKEITSNAVAITDGDSKTVGDFTLDFFGTDHARIDPSYPAAQNSGVLVNGKFYHPGDSFTECTKPHEWLSLPTIAPWLKYSESMDFLKKSPAKNFFPTHNGFLNEDGLALYNRLHTAAAQETGKTYKFLKVGESVEI